jgi:uncharacterized protein
MHATPRARPRSETEDMIDCQDCGACCAYSAAWPRFTLESDDALDYLPPELVRDDLGGMACDGDRCRALSGKVGERTACTVHPVRPDVCRACMPGDPECLLARAFHGLGPLAGQSAFRHA